VSQIAGCERCYAFSRPSRPLAHRGRYSGNPSRGDRDIPVIEGQAVSAGGVEEPVVDRCAFGLVVADGVVGLGSQGRSELDGGLVVPAAFADRLVDAVGGGGPVASAVGEHSAVLSGELLEALLGVGGGVEGVDFGRRADLLGASPTWFAGNLGVRSALAVSLMASWARRGT
jgi:hypothetical protein